MDCHLKSKRLCTLWKIVGLKLVPPKYEDTLETLVLSAGVRAKLIYNAIAKLNDEES